MSGSFKQSIIEAGELDAISASVIMTPKLGWQYGYQLKLIGLAEHGKLVKKGDSVISLDPASVYKIIIGLEESLESYKAIAMKQSVQRDNNIQDLIAQLKNEQASFDLKKLEVERLVYESPSKRKVKELEFKQASIRLENVKRNLELKPKLEDIDIKIQETRIRLKETDIEEARKVLKKLTIYSPQDGIFQVANLNFSAQQIRLGDNIYRGTRIASIPDISKMKAKSYINETDIRKVKPGMKVIIRLDALPKVPFNGIVSKISKVCSRRNNERVFTTEIEIQESDIRLKPGMTVSCEYLCLVSETDLYVPNSCILREGNQYFVFLDKGKRPFKLEVKAGASNSKYTIIYSQLKAGTRIIPIDKIDPQKES